MESRQLGKTGLRVSRLGIGLAEMGGITIPDGVEEAGRLLNAALDGGINFLDTAECYDNSEQLIGETVAHRRDEYVLATKCGHLAGGASGQHWTASTVEESIDRSLRRLKTDHLDLVQLHSCDLDVLQRGEVIDALLKAKEAGKTRFAGYSGDNEAGVWAVESGLFDTLQTSLSLVDQSSRVRLLKPAAANGMGVIIKRPIGNVTWGAEQSTPTAPPEYIVRARAMARPGPIAGAQSDPVPLTLGFVFAHPEVDTAIVGTRNLSHLRSNIAMVERGVSLPTETVEAFHHRFDEVGADWPGRS